MKECRLENLSCANCAAKMERKLSELESVKSVSIDFATKTMKIDAEDLSLVESEIRKIEPDVNLIEPDEPEEHDHDEFNAKEEIATTAISLILFASGVIFENALRSTPFQIGYYGIFVASYLAAGWRVLYSAIRNIIHGSIFDENFLMTISTLGAFIVKAEREAAAVMIFFRIGEFFQDLAVHRSRRSISSLLAIRPDSANVIRNDEIIKLHPEDVSVGETIVVKPGEKVPLDGRVTSGSSQLDTSLLTGESLPRTVETGDDILAGSINRSGVLHIQVTKIFGESSIAKILTLVQDAAHKKAKTEKMITSFARYYTPLVVAAALMLALIPPVATGGDFSLWLYRAMVLLVISCPCALVVSIPLGYFGGIGGSSRRGILVKGGNHLDALAKLETVVFDKTGTLTKGVFKVTEVHTENGFTEDELLRYASEAEYHSNHPIALSIKESYKGEIELSEVEEYNDIPGFGVIARIKGRSVIVGNDKILHRESIDHHVCCKEGTVVHVAIERVHAGYLVISDEVKDDAKEAVSLLKKRGIRSVMLTGDSREAALSVADKLGIESFHAELLPEEKVSVMEKILGEKKRGRTVAFVGDGVNDAPVIARADVGIAMGKGSDSAIETADIVLMTDHPSKIAEGVERSIKTRRIVIQNIVFALGVKTGFMVLGAFGVATMWEAVFADVGVALIAVFNATRTLR